MSQVNLPSNGSLSRNQNIYHTEIDQEAEQILNNRGNRGPLP